MPKAPGDEVTSPQRSVIADLGLWSRAEPEDESGRAGESLLSGSKGMVTMDVAVVFESMFGMTHDVADAVAAGVAEARPDARVMCLRVGDATPERLGTPDLLVVGGPTHLRGMSLARTRRMAVSIEEKADRGEGKHQGRGLEPGVEGPGLRDWFHGLPKAGKGRWAAAFDTRGDYGPMVGGAARGIARRLKGHGYELVADPEGFIVEGDAGQLRTGERERAHAWASELTRRAAQATAPSR